MSSNEIHLKVKTHVFCDDFWKLLKVYLTKFSERETDNIKMCYINIWFIWSLIHSHLASTDLNSG